MSEFVIRAAMIVVLPTIAATALAASSSPSSAKIQQPQLRDYQAACASCHERGGFAVRVLTDRVGADRALIRTRDDLSPDVIRAVVRSGMGAMPAMSRIELSDEELSRIADELTRADRHVRQP